jgi:hypothetical protein
MEKMTIISLHNYNYLVLTMQAVDAEGGDMYHPHSIVVKVGGKEAQFNFDRMLDCLDKASITTLREQLTMWYTPWSNTNAAITHRRLNNIFLTVTRVMLQGTGATGRTQSRSQVVRIVNSQTPRILERREATIGLHPLALGEPVSVREQLDCRSNLSHKKRGGSPQPGRAVLVQYSHL